MSKEDTITEEALTSISEMNDITIPNINCTATPEHALCIITVSDSDKNYVKIHFAICENQDQ